jgi:aspartyl-tRNA synthetase
MTYSDGSQISRIGHLIPATLTNTIGPLAKPIVEVFRASISDDPSITRKFVFDFMSSPEAQPFISNPSGQPGIFIYDPRKPLSGLHPFGFEAAEYLEDTLSLTDGDLLVLQARPDAPHSGGSTPLGNLRLTLHRLAVAKGLIQPAPGWSFLWINNFPLFTPTNDADPGQGGSAGLSSTHHPFTAPASLADVDLLITEPLAVKADHYDLVLNGVELGGGSRRIHSADFQRYILRDVLKVSEERMHDFEHLIEVLRMGCPPHAGLAIGFDRLIATMLGKESIRDVIAFPKTQGRDLLVRSPGRITQGQLRTYGLKLRD